ncbi:hypothetical protein D6C87_09288 [Aureobasidium pullulans]|uniref:Uncharacterized protein n=1 Tax=Aureobasidium pullulans TaxID=5580 RepID=A0AB38MAD0_AURPU|nr:hypothetical protein D6C94_00406 [Aureobasidium pullulans]THZ36246.1 hypothetical protein D6C87_09288 [Aureobasidium pullulans]
MADEDEVVFGKIFTADIKLLEEIVGQAKCTVNGAVIHAHKIERFKTMISNLKPATPSSQPDHNDTPIQVTVEDIIVDTTKNLTAPTAEDLAASTLVHEARTRVTKWIMETENPPCILVRAEYSDKALLDFNIILNKDLYSIRNDKMVQLSFA